MHERIVSYEEVDAKWYPHNFENPKPYLRLRAVGRTWSIIRVQPFQRFGSEVVASGLTRADAERLINLTKEK